MSSIFKMGIFERLCAMIVPDLSHFKFRSHNNGFDVRSMLRTTPLFKPDVTSGTCLRLQFSRLRSLRTGVLVSMAASSAVRAPIGLSSNRNDSSNPVKRSSPRGSAFRLLYRNLILSTTDGASGSTLPNSIEVRSLYSMLGNIKKYIQCQLYNAHTLNNGVNHSFRTLSMERLSKQLQVIMTMTT